MGKNLTERGAVMIYHNLMELIQRNEAAIIEELVYEIRGQEETRHYGNLSDEMLNERLHHVLYNVYKRLSNWLHNNTSKNVVFAYYTGLGRERYKEGIPLEEVIQVLFIIKKKCRVVLEEFDKAFAVDAERMAALRMCGKVGTDHRDFALYALVAEEALQLLMKPPFMFE